MGKTVNSNAPKELVKKAPGGAGENTANEGNHTTIKVETPQGKTEINVKKDHTVMYIVVASALGLVAGLLIAYSKPGATWKRYAAWGAGGTIVAGGVTYGAISFMSHKPA